MTDFRDLVGDDLTPEEEARLRRVHELLVEAGPPPELPPELARPDLPAASTEIKLFPHLPRRRVAASLVLVAAVAAIFFGAGYLVADNGNGGGFRTERLLAMHPTSAGGLARASIALGPVDDAGNWPLQLRVANLPEQSKGRYYELWLVTGGKRVTCGTFRMTSKTTTVLLNAPYRLKAADAWVVTEDGSRTVLLTT